MILLQLAHHKQFRIAAFSSFQLMNGSSIIANSSTTKETRVRAARTKNNINVNCPICKPHRHFNTCQWHTGRQRHGGRDTSDRGELYSLIDGDCWAFARVKVLNFCVATGHHKAKSTHLVKPLLTGLIILPLCKLLTNASSALLTVCEPVIVELLTRFANVIAIVFRLSRGKRY